MDERIYVDRLRQGETQEITHCYEPNELELSTSPVTVQIRAYSTDDHLILHLDIETTAQIPCKICNDPINVPIKIENQTHVEPHENIRSRVYDFTPLVKENLILALPQFAECEGDCPERANLKDFLC